MTCGAAFAKGPRPGEFVLVADEGHVAWLYLLAGVRIILTEFGESTIFSGLLDTRAGPDPCFCALQSGPNRGSRFCHSYPGWDWCSSLSRLADAVETTDLARDDTATAAVFRLPIQSLRRCFESLIADPDSDIDPGVDFANVMRWVYYLEDPFIQALRRRNRVAITLLGFFGVLLRGIQYYWFLDGWGDQILRESRQTLGPLVFDEWLPWPKDLL